MYIVRWLMGHPIIAAWVLAAIAIALNMGSGTKLGHEESKDSGHLSSVTDTSADVGATSSSGDAAINDKAEINSNDPIKSDIKKSKIVKESNPDIIKKHADPSAVLSLDVDSNENGDLGHTSTQEMLKMAREAYWNNGLDEAAQIYSQLIKIEPKVVEHQGELGNVYWKLGNTKKAAEIYSNIAIPLIDSGKVEKVVNMLSFISLHYPDRATEIQKRLEAAKSENKK